MCFLPEPPPEGSEDEYPEYYPDYGTNEVDECPPML